MAPSLGSNPFLQAACLCEKLRAGQALNDGHVEDLTEVHRRLRDGDLAEHGVVLRAQLSALLRRNLPNTVVKM